MTTQKLLSIWLPADSVSRDAKLAPRDQSEESDGENLSAYRDQRMRFWRGQQCGGRVAKGLYSLTKKKSTAYDTFSFRRSIAPLLQTCNPEALA